MENDTAALVRKYQPNFPKINECTMREFKRNYEVQLRHSKNNAGQEAGTDLTAELGKLDGMVQTFIRSAFNRGAVVTRSMAVVMAKARMVRYPDIIGKIDLGNSEWTKRLFRRMDYTRRKGTTAKLEIPIGLRKEAELLFHHQIVKRVEANQILD